MKITNIILSIVIIIISCLPCADMEIDSSAHKATQFSEAHSDHSHTKLNDQCSPFCICNCCGVQVLSYAAAINFDFRIMTALIKSPLPDYTSVFASNFYGSIWQPPQIV